MDAAVRRQVGRQHRIIFEILQHCLPLVGQHIRFHVGGTGPVALLLEMVGQRADGHGIAVHHSARAGNLRRRRDRHCLVAHRHQRHKYLPGLVQIPAGFMGGIKTLVLQVIRRDVHRHKVVAVAVPIAPLSADAAPACGGGVLHHIQQHGGAHVFIVILAVFFGVVVQQHRVFLCARNRVPAQVQPAAAVNADLQVLRHRDSAVLDIHLGQAGGIQLFALIAVILHHPILVVVEPAVILRLLVIAALVAKLVVLALMVKRPLKQVLLRGAQHRESLRIRRAIKTGVLQFSGAVGVAIQGVGPLHGK